MFDGIMKDLHVKPDVYDQSGHTPLHLACEQGRTSAVVKLIALGANTNVAVPGTRMTPLHMAARYVNV